MKTYTISLGFQLQGKNPLDVVEKAIRILEENLSEFIYDVKDEETGEKFTVDMAELEDKNKVLPNNN